MLRWTAAVLAAFLSASLSISGICAESVTSEPNVAAKYYEAYDMTSEQELIGKNEKGKMYPASITKVLFAEVMLERLNEMGKAPDDIAGKVSSADNEKAASNGLYRSGLKDGESVSYEDLLHSIIYMSGAEACYAAVRLTFGNESSAASAMNKKAESLGMSSSHFVNITGAHNQNHYTTCSDFVKVMRNAWNNSTLKNIFTTDSYKTTDGKHTFRSPTSRAASICSGLLIGGKTGTTDPAQHTFAGYANIKGHTVIIITALSPLSISQSNLKDASAVSKFIGDEYELKNIPDSLKSEGYVYTPVTKGQLLMRKGTLTTKVGNESIVMSSGGQTVVLKAKKSVSDTKTETKKTKITKRKSGLRAVFEYLRDFLIKIFG